MVLSLDAFLTQRSIDRRLARLTHDIPLPEARGLEIGACANPISHPEGWEVEYVDYKTSETTELPGGIAPKYVWTGAKPLSDVCSNSEYYDFVVAAQVAKYVPNLLGWFRDIFDVLSPSGVLNISLPDKRFMFDINRNVSTIGEALEAYYANFTRPSIRQLVDHTYQGAKITPEEIWSAEFVPSKLPRFCGDLAIEFAQSQCLRALANPDLYIACHCWVFTPLSFLDMIENATRIGIFPLVFNQLSLTEPNGFEFYASFRRDPEKREERLREIQLAGIRYLREIVEDQLRVAQRLART